MRKDAKNAPLPFVRVDSASRTCDKTFMSKVVKLRQSSASEANGKADERFAAIRALVQTLDSDEQQRLIKEIQSVIGPVPKGGDVLTAIVKFIGDRKSWTVTEIKKKVDDQGILASQKEVYNAVGYLNRKGHIQRIGYGQYIVDGRAFVTSEDLGPDLRYEESYQEQD